MNAINVLAQAVVNGLLIGGVYALVAVGLNLMFGVMKLVNFAHGEFLMMGMYVAVALAGLALPASFIGIYWVAVPAMLIMAVVGACFLSSAARSRCKVWRVAADPSYNRSFDRRARARPGIAWFRFQISA